jgi:molecular chaperone DnaK (HSP70)
MIFGIDFGTTYTVISWMDNNKHLKFFPWSKGQYLLSTQMNEHYNLKRLLADTALNNSHEYLKIYKLVCAFFIQLNLAIESKLSVTGVKECVLTVPARFDDIARNAIKAAAISAGFHVLKLLAEPVACAIYSVGQKKNGYYLVYDLGGGTFDATLLKFHDDVFQILALDGLADFGGIDIDNLIALQKNISLENAKIYKETDEYLQDDKLIEEINKMLEPTYKILNTMLFKNNLTKKDINQLILAGGSCRIPTIRQHLTNDYFIEKEILDLDLLVAAGAAMHGNNIHLQNIDQLELNNQKQDLHLLIDAVAFDLGIETLGDEMEIIIPKNSPLPCMRTQRFQPVAINVCVSITILQGIDCAQASDAIKLASFEIQSKEPFDVMFMIDCDGIISVKIGNEVHVVSAKFDHIVDREIETLYIKATEYIKNISTQTLEQKQYMQYLEQAKNISITKDAKNWLKQRFQELFES